MCHFQDILTQLLVTRKITCSFQEKKIHVFTVGLLKDSGTGIWMVVCFTMEIAETSYAII